jgi:hypothetical protein
MSTSIPVNRMARWLEENIGKYYGGRCEGVNTQDFFVWPDFECTIFYYHNDMRRNKHGIHANYSHLMMRTEGIIQLSGTVSAIGKFPDCQSCNCLCERKWEGRPSHTSESLSHQSAMWCSTVNMY